MRKFVICFSLLACNTPTSSKLQDIKISKVEIHVLSSSNEKFDTSCPSDMKLVKGNFCPQVEQKCLKWLDKDKRPEANFGIGPLRCAEFEYSKCLSKKRQLIKVCMDTFEWPNKENEFPLVTIDWHSAKAKCESINKRLCTADEWTFACEGEEIKPYPYGDGYHRDATACNIDEPSMDPSLPRSEWPKHNRSVPSGVMPNCVSWAGVHDLTGNVDEYVFNSNGSYTKAPFISGLKGGYWGPVRARCRPMTDVHGPTHSFYQQGFRCCADVSTK